MKRETKEIRLQYTDERGHVRCGMWDIHGARPHTYSETDVVVVRDTDHSHRDCVERLREFPDCRQRAEKSESSEENPESETSQENEGE